MAERTVERRPWYRRAAHTVVSLGVVAAIFALGIPAIADYGRVWDTLRAMSPLGFLVLLAIAVLSISAYWWVLTAAMPGLTLVRAGVVNQASTAVANTLPGGGAIALGISYAMYRSWGFGRSDIARAVVVSGVWDAAMKLALPAAALGLLLAMGDPPAGLAAAAAAGLALFGLVVVGFAVVIRSDRLARWLGRTVQRTASWGLRRLGRPPVEGWEDRASRLRSAAFDVIRSRWARLTIAAGLAHLALFSVLYASLRVVGVPSSDVTLVEAFGAFAFVRLLQVLPITPGGAGLVELGYAAVLTRGLDDLAAAAVVAAILVFRFLSFALPILFGAVAWAAWRAGLGTVGPEAPGSGGSATV
jgi:uncharacterized membrane protein YbhN (UPF0104 family)